MASSWREPGEPGGEVARFGEAGPCLPLRHWHEHLGHWRRQRELLLEIAKALAAGLPPLVRFNELQMDDPQFWLNTLRPQSPSVREGSRPPVPRPSGRALVL